MFKLHSRFVEVMESTEIPDIRVFIHKSEFVIRDSIVRKLNSYTMNLNSAVNHPMKLVIDLVRMSDSFGMSIFCLPETKFSENMSLTELDQHSDWVCHIREFRSLENGTQYLFNSFRDYVSMIKSILER